MKVPFIIFFSTLVSVARLTIFGRPSVSYNRPGQYRSQVHYNYRPQVKPLRYNTVNRVAPVNRQHVYSQRRAQLIEPLYNSSSFNSLPYGEKLHIDTNTQGFYNHQTTSQIHHITGDNSYHQPTSYQAPTLYDQSLGSVISHLISLVSQTNGNNAVVIDKATAQVTISYLQELQNKQSQSIVAVNPEYEQKIQGLNDKIQSLESRIGILEQEKTALLNQGNVAGANAIEHQEQQLASQENQISLEILKTQDVELRQEIQQVNAEGQQLEIEGGHDVELAAIETQKVDLEVKDALVDQQIKQEEVVQLETKIDELKDQKVQIEQTTNNPVQIEGIQAEITHTEQEHGAVASDNQIITEVIADIQTDQQKIDQLTQEGGHTDQVIALIRAKRKLTKLLRKLQDEDPEETVTNEDIPDESAPPSDSESTEPSEDASNESAPPSDFGSTSQCETIDDLKAHFELLADRIYAIYQIPPDYTLAQMQDEYNKTLQDTPDFYQAPIECINNFKSRLDNEPIESLTGISFDNPEDPDKLIIEDNLRAALNDEVMNIINTKIDGFLISPIQNVEENSPQFVSINSGDEGSAITAAVSLTEEVDLYISKLQDAKSNLINASDKVNEKLQNTGTTASSDMGGDSSVDVQDIETRRLRNNYITGRYGINKGLGYKIPLI